MMEATVKLNMDDLSMEFIEKLRFPFPHKELEIRINSFDDTEYLESSSANHQKLMESIERVKKKTGLIEVKMEDLI